jgi:hypothetical protein
MAPHQSIVNRLLVGVFCTVAVCLLTLPVVAQRAVPHSAGGAVHTSAPPIAHAPISLAPIFHAPISAARMPIGSSAGGGIGTPRYGPSRRPIRPFPPVLVIYETPFLLGGSFWGWNSCWWSNCNLLWPWMLDYFSVSSPGPTNYVSQVYETPVYDYGEERPDLPQLFLKDGTILNVTDYWLVDDQLHFTMIESEGGEPVEHVIPFDALDLQTSVDANTRRGFRFMLRNEPFEQYLRDHPDGPPQAPALPRN